MTRHGRPPTATPHHLHCCPVLSSVAHASISKPSQQQLSGARLSWQRWLSGPPDAGRVEGRSAPLLPNATRKPLQPKPILPSTMWRRPQKKVRPMPNNTHPVTGVSCGTSAKADESCAADLLPQTEAGRRDDFLAYWRPCRPLAVPARPDTSCTAQLRPKGAQA